MQKTGVAIAAINSPDYRYKWDPNRIGTPLEKPEVNFTIKDDSVSSNNEYQYKWTVYFTSTSLIHKGPSTNWLTDPTTSKASSVKDVPESVNVKISDFINFSTNEPGTYAYDIVVEKMEVGKDKVIDKFQFKSPYTSWIPENFKNGGVTRQGHSVMNFIHESNQTIEIRANYYLYPYPQSALSKAQMTVIDPDLEERAIVDGSTATGVLNGGTHGYYLYSRGFREKPGDWRVVFTGLDESGKHLRRDHKSQRMIPVNQVSPERELYQLYVNSNSPGIEYKDTLHYIYFVQANEVTYGGRTQAQQIGVSFQNSVAKALGKTLVPDDPKFNLITGSRPDIMTGVAYVPPQPDVVGNIYDFSFSALRFYPRSHIVKSRR